MLSGARRDLDGAAPLEIGGKLRRLRLTLDGLAAIEERQQVIGQALDVGTLRLFLWAMLAHDEPLLTLREVGSWVDLERLPEIAAAVQRALDVQVHRQPDSAAAGAGAERKTNWPALWAMGRSDLGLSAAEFWALTPLQFHYLVERWQERSERDLFRSALICAVVAECHRDRKKRKKPFTPADFMPALKRRERQEDRQQHMQAMRARVEMLAALFGGKLTHGKP